MKKIIKIQKYLETIQKNSWNGYFFNLPPYGKTELLNFGKKQIGHFDFTKEEILNTTFDEQQKSYLFYCLNKKLIYKNENNN